MAKLFFHHVAAGPPDPIFALAQEFREDKRSPKVDLCAGIYRDEELHVPLLHAVSKAEKAIAAAGEARPYLPIEGDKNFIDKMGALVFGDFLWRAKASTIFGAQTPGGTGALRVGGEFLQQEVAGRIAYPDPTWPNHRMVFTRAGLGVEVYPYYDFEKKGIDFGRCLKFLKGLSPGTAVLSLIRRKTRPLMAGMKGARLGG